MKKIAALALVGYSLSLASFAQDKLDQRRVIEVSGSSERLVVPDEFTFKITLVERIENKKKITIEDQESALRSELVRLGVDVAKDLSIYDISSMYFRQKKLKDVLGLKDFRLKIRDLNKIAQLQDLADRLNIGRLDLIDTDNSKMTEIRREVKIEAIKAAKAKAEYLLMAIGQRLGSAVYIGEEEESSPINGRAASNIYSNNISVSGGVLDSQNSEPLSFTATRVRFVINAKFEID